MPYNRQTGEYYEPYNRNGNYRGVTRVRDYRSNQPAKKKSGCKIGQDKKGRPVITGWNVSKGRGFVSMVAVPTNKPKTKSPNSDKWVASVKFPDGKKTFTAFYNVNSKKLTIPDLNMVANPKAPNGGYFGTFVTRKNR